MKILIEESVLRQALDALEPHSEYTQVSRTGDSPVVTYENDAHKAITALRTALDAAEQDNKRITELEAVIKSHGIPVKTYSGGVAHYCTKEEV